MCFWKRRLRIAAIDVQAELADESVDPKRKTAIVKALLAWVHTQEHLYLTTKDEAVRVEIHNRLDAYVHTIQELQDWLLVKDFVRPAIVHGEDGWVALFSDYKDLYYACEQAKNMIIVASNSMA